MAKPVELTVHLITDEQLKELVEVLKFYADHQNHVIRWDDDGQVKRSIVADDMGEKARNLIQKLLGE